MPMAVNGLSQMTIQNFHAFWCFEIQLIDEMVDGKLREWKKKCRVFKDVSRSRGNSEDLLAPRRDMSTNHRGTCPAVLSGNGIDQRHGAPEMKTFVIQRERCMGMTCQPSEDRPAGPAMRLCLFNFVHRNDCAHARLRIS